MAITRDIKFRAWDGLNKVTKYYTLKQLAEYDQFSCDTEYEAIQSGFDNWVWMQFTGLKDKNGKEIYEGDVVKGGIVGWEIMKKKPRISIVEWRDKGFWIKDEDFGWEGENIWDWSLLEIIGNIFETPELIKQG